MSEQNIRPLVKSIHAKAVKDLVCHPPSADFDDSLRELLKRFRQLKENSKRSDKING